MNRVGGGAFPRARNAVVAAILIAVTSAGSTRAHAEEPRDPPRGAAAPDRAQALAAPSRATFVARELGVGVGGVVLSAAAGFATAAFVFQSIYHPSSDCGDMCGFGEALVSTGVGGLALVGGYFAGIPSFVWLAGNGREGRGRYSAAVVGSFTGLAIDVGITALAASAGGFNRISSGALGAYFVAMLFVPVATAAAGFELSVRDEAPARAATAETPTVAPFVAPLSGRGGISAGLAGRF
jgi:hypothetical protein